MVVIAYLDSSLRTTFYHISHYIVEDDVALFTGISLLVRISIISICSMKLKPTTLLAPVNWCPNGTYLVIYYTLSQSCHMDDGLYNTNSCYSSDVYVPNAITPAKYFIMATEFVLKYFNSMIANIIQMHRPIIL